MKSFFLFLAFAIIVAPLNSVFAQKVAPPISKLDPAMDVNKKAAADLDWHNVTEWGVEGRILPNQERQRGSIGCRVRPSRPLLPVSGVLVGTAPE